MSTLSRRTILRGTVASATLIAPAALADSGGAAADTLIELGSQWQEALSRNAAAYAEWERIYDTVPEWGRALPRLDRAPGELEIPSWITGGHGVVSLKDIRQYNHQTEAIVASGHVEHPDLAVEYKRRRAQGRARVRWWIAERRRQQELEEASGLKAADDATEATYDGLSAIEDKIRDTPATSAEGVAVKPRIVARWIVDTHSDSDGNIDYSEMGQGDRITLDLVRELDQLAGKGVQA